MDGFNAGADSQAAYAAMPDQGLPSQPAGMTDQQKKAIAQMLMVGAQGAQQPAGQMAAPVRSPQTSYQAAGGFVNTMGGR